VEFFLSPTAWGGGAPPPPPPPPPPTLPTLLQRKP